jgi:hypothetical protein
MLKKDFNANSGEILRTERELNNIVEMDLREEILKMKHFDGLNNEKITPCGDRFRQRERPYSSAIFSVMYSVQSQL